jgi:hypothetical protein
MRRDIYIDDVEDDIVEEEEEDEEEEDDEEEDDDNDDYVNEYDRDETPELEETDEDTEIIYNPEDYDQHPTDTADGYDTDHNNLYDIYSIHQVNEQNRSLFGSNLTGTNFGLGYGQASYSNINSEILSCPICGEWLHIVEVNDHVMNQHTSFYVTMNILLNRNITVDNVQQMINNIYSNEHQVNTSANIIARTYDTLQSLMFLENTEYEPSYEDLLNLCDHIGYHKPGIKDIDAVTTVVEEEERCRLLKEEETCRICLECFTLEDEIRKINSCNHVFGSDCIKTWFSENKTCPLCNLSVTEIGPEPEPQQVPITTNNLEDVD